MQIPLWPFVLREIPVGPTAVVNFTPDPADCTKATQAALLGSHKSGRAFGQCGQPLNISLFLAP